MGCDIHLYKEKQVRGRWVTADEGWIPDPDVDELVQIRWIPHAAAGVQIHGHGTGLAGHPGDLLLDSRHRVEPGDHASSIII